MGHNFNGQAAADLKVWPTGNEVAADLKDATKNLTLNLNGVVAN